MKIHRILLLMILVFSLIALSGCLKEESRNYSYSFEDGFDSWEVNGTDLEDPSGDGEQNWSITIINESKYGDHPGINFSTTDGSYLLEYYLNNKNDAGKIWIERTFDLEKNKRYTIDMSFDLGTTHYGINKWTMIAGEYNGNEVDDLPFKGKVEKEEPGFGWISKNYSFRTESNDNGEIRLAIGIWGTWEAPRTYFIDNVSIKIY